MRLIDADALLKNPWFVKYRGIRDEEFVNSIIVQCRDIVRNAPTVGGVEEVNLYDEEEVHENCTVQILKNSVTGDISIGWWKNDNR